jgi:hypothetical protein
MYTFEPVSLLVGVALLLLGRRRYWVFVAGVGFLAGGYLFHVLAQALGWGEWAWVGFLAGGVVGGLLVLSVVGVLVQARQVTTRPKAA